MEVKVEKGQINEMKRKKGDICKSKERKPKAFGSIFIKPPKDRFGNKKKRDV